MHVIYLIENNMHLFYLIIICNFFFYYYFFINVISSGEITNFSLVMYTELIQSYRLIKPVPFFQLSSSLHSDLPCFNQQPKDWKVLPLHFCFLSIICFFFFLDVQNMVLLYRRKVATFNTWKLFDFKSVKFLIRKPLVRRNIILFIYLK